MAGTTRPETTLRDVYRVLFRHKGKAGGFFIIAMAAAISAAIFLPKVYRSEAKLFVRLGRENATLDPTASPGQGRVVVVPQTREHEINSVVEILGSRVLLEKVADAVGPALILDRETDTPTDGAQPEKAGWLERLKLVTPLSDREKATATLGDNLSVSPARKSNVIVISYDSHSPQVSQMVADRLVDSYKQEHARLNRTRGARDFFDEQTSRLGLELSQAQERLRDLKNETGLAEPQKQRELVLERIGRVEDELLRTWQQKAAAETRVARLKEKVANAPANQITAETTGLGNEGTDEMRGQLYALLLKEQEMLAKYTDRHPRVVAIRQQTIAAREILRREESTRKQTITGPSLVVQKGQIELVREEPLLASLHAQSEALRTQLTEVRGELKELNENEVKITRLEREVELRESDYRNYAANLEQARIDEALEDGRISNISVVQPATLEMKPVKPKRLVLLGLGLVVGLGGALGLALTAEYLDRSFRGPEDIERQLDLPTLASIPRLKRAQLTCNGKGNHHGH